MSVSTLSLAILSIVRIKPLSRQIQVLLINRKLGLRALHFQTDFFNPQTLHFQNGVYSQKRGIGTSLVNQGLLLLKEIGGQGCALAGDPNYYKRCGFKNYPEMVHEGIPQEVFLALPFTENVPKGLVVFHEGFLAKG